MYYELKQMNLFGGCCYHKAKIKDTDGYIHDYSSGRVQPQKHHRIITTEDGYKLALNTCNGIAYRIIGENYESK